MSTATATATATAASAPTAAPLQPESLFAIAQAYERSASSAIAFRRMTRCDAFPWFTATRNPAFNAFLLWDAPEDLAGMAAHIDKLLREDRSFLRVAVSGVDLATGAWRGMVVVRPYEDGHELGLALHPEVWGQGMLPLFLKPATEVIRRAATPWPLYARTHRDNAKMQTILRRNGFEEAGKMTETRLNGEQIPLDIYRLGPDWTPPEMIAY
jgi:RimJ/RimL family protein N-acetyltransferase